MANKLPAGAATLSVAPLYAFDKSAVTAHCEQLCKRDTQAASADAVHEFRHSLEVAAWSSHFTPSTSLCTKTILPLLVLCLAQPSQAECTEIPEVILASRLLNLLYYAAVSYFVIRRGFVDRQFATILFILCSSVYVLAEEPLDEVVVDSLGELFWTYLNLLRSSQNMFTPYRLLSRHSQRHRPLIQSRCYLRAH